MKHVYLGKPFDTQSLMEGPLQPLVLAVLPVLEEESTGGLRLAKPVSLPDVMVASELSSLTMLQDAHSTLFSQTSLDTVRDEEQDHRLRLEGASGGCLIQAPYSSRATQSWLPRASWLSNISVQLAVEYLH